MPLTTRGFARIDGVGQPRLIGYARVSTDEQSPDLQLDALRRAGVMEDNLHVDKASGIAKSRPGLRHALMDARAGDTLVVWKLDRLGRSLLDLLNHIEALEARGVGFRSLTEGIDTTTPAGRMLMHVIGALAQFERDLIVERTKAGMAAAKARGKKFGPKQTIDVAEAESLFRKGWTVDQVREHFGVKSRQAIYRYFNASAVLALQEEGREARRRKPRK